MSSLITYLGLYSGCGGSDFGFYKKGFESVGAIDINIAALNVHNKNLPGPIFNEDLRTCQVDDLIGKSQVDVIFSGAPCQGFSTAGMRKVDDPRNSLLLRGGEIALELGSKVFISENVMGSVSGKHKKLCWILTAMCGALKQQFHPWIKPMKRVPNKSLKQLQQVYPTWKESDLETLDNIITDREGIQMLERKEDFFIGV